MQHKDPILISVKHSASSHFCSQKNIYNAQIIAKTQQKVSRYLQLIYFSKLLLENP